MVSPYFFLKKSDDPFSHRPLESDNLFLAVVSSPLPPSRLVYPVFFLNSATAIIVFWCNPLDSVTRGGPPRVPSRIHATENGVNCYASTDSFYCFKFCCTLQFEAKENSSRVYRCTSADLVCLAGESH